MDLLEIRSISESLRQQVHRVVVGQEDAIDLMLVTMLCEGHVLLEGVPGTAKTLLGRTFAAGLALRFGRIQFTPDLMPGDLLGTNLFNFQTNQFVLTRGPFANAVACRGVGDASGRIHEDAGRGRAGPHRRARRHRQRRRRG